MPDTERVIVDARGRPAREARDHTCPNCGASPDKRRLSSGFGSPHDVCAVCGYEWLTERTAEQ